MSSPGSIGKPFIELPTVESTNNYAMGLAREGMAQGGTAVFAHEQTAGKGQRNRAWHSQKGKNIALSIIVQPPVSVTGQPFLLSMAAAFAVWQFFNNHVPDDIRIKWPNDLYWRDRKAAGILIENLWQGAIWKYAVIGIGINVNQEEFGLLSDKAVSLYQITGTSYQPVELAKELCTHMDRTLRLMDEDPMALRAAYRKLLYGAGEEIKLRKENRVFMARMLGVTDDGELLVFHTLEEKYSIGSVEWLI